MGSSKNANFVTGALGGESFKTSKLYKDAASEKPDSSFAQPSPEVKKIEPKKESVSASEKAESLKDNELVVEDRDKKPFVSKPKIISTVKRKNKTSQRVESKQIVKEEKEEEEEDGRED